MKSKAHNLHDRAVCCNCNHYKNGALYCNALEQRMPSNETCPHFIYKIIIDWEQRRYEIAKEAMNGLLAAPVVEGIDPNPPMDDIARNAVKIADYLIEELKKGGEE